MWPLVRLSLYSATFGSGSPQHGLGAGWGRRLRNVAGGLLSWGHARLSDRGANRRPNEPADAVFLTTSAGRRPLLEGRRFDLRAGPFVELLDRLGARSLVWQMSPFGDYNVPRHLPSFLLQPRLVTLRAACQIVPLGDDRVALESYDEFLARLRAAGLRFPHADVERCGAMRCSSAAWPTPSRRGCRDSGHGSDLWPTPASRSRRSASPAASWASPPIELQHGVQGDLHPSYGSWFAVPRTGWETRARVFWSWDEDSAAAINRWAACAPDAHVAIVGGDPWREMWLDESSDQARRTGGLIEQRKRAPEASTTSW